MSVQTTAALYGAISGAVITGLFNVGILVGRYFLRRRGGIEFTPSNWRFAYLAYPLYERHQNPDETGRMEPYYSLWEVHQNFDSSEVNHAVYGFTADLLNKMDVADTLRDVSVAFMKSGAIVFTHRPFDEDNTTDRTPLVFELPSNRSRYELPKEGFHPPGHGIEPIGAISLSGHESRRIRLKGYVSGSDVHHLLGGCDEVRLRVTRENGKLFDEHVSSKDTKHQPRPSGGVSVGMISM